MLKKMLSNTLSMNVVLNKSLGYLFWDVCYLKNGHEKCHNTAQFKDNQQKLFEVLHGFMTFQKCKFHHYKLFAAATGLKKAKIKKNL